MATKSWEQITVRELVEKGQAEIKTGPFGTQLHASDYVEHGTPVINARNIGFGNIRPEKLEYISDETVKRLSSHLLRPADIVFGRKGTVERHVFIKQEQNDWFQGTDCLRLRLISPDVEPRFVSYYLMTDGHKQWIINQSSHGATMTSLNQDIISRISFPFPPLPTQRRIADILSAYDDLIENNTRRIRILEQMAQAIYQEWFGKVDEKFLPKGWELIEVKQIINRLPKGTVYEQQDVIEEGEVIVIDQSRAEFLGFHNNTPDFEASPSNPIAIFGDHTCKMQLLVRPFSIGPNVVPFTSKLGYPIHYVFSVVSGLVETKEYKRHWNDLSAKKVALPPLELAKEFSVIIEPMLAQQDMLARKNAILRRTRDLLLPRLVSGEIELQ